MFHQIEKHTHTHTRLNGKLEMSLFLIQQNDEKGRKKRKLR